MALLQMEHKLRVGFLINPWAGIGGEVGLKGSDGSNILEKAISRGATPKAEQRAKTTLMQLSSSHEKIEFYSVAGNMGGDVLQQLNFKHQNIYFPETNNTTAQDTKKAIQLFASRQIDLLLFAGGDGTARDVFDALSFPIPVIGIPAGTKIHSGVYCLTPKVAGDLVNKIVGGQVIELVKSTVMDINEDLFRQGKVQARRYGELYTPNEPNFIQSDKSGTTINEHIEIDDLAEHVGEEMEKDHLYIMGTGSTIATIMDLMRLENSLLGIDVILNMEVVGIDVNAEKLKSLLLTYADLPKTLFVTFIGGQGHVFGRGNQQLTPENLKLIGKYNIQIVASRTKVRNLKGRPLIADTGDIKTDQWLSGRWRILTGYHQHILYPLQ